MLESETKRSSSKKPTEAEANNAADTVDNLNQEVAMLKRDLQTAERIAKQSEVAWTHFSSPSLRDSYLGWFGFVFIFLVNSIAI